MNRREALLFIQSPHADDRLRGARVLGRMAERVDAAAIRERLDAEQNRWVRSALRKAHDRATRPDSISSAEVSLEDDEEKMFAQVYADAVQETTQRFIHELRPVLGRLDVEASREIHDYEASGTKVQWLQMKEMISAISRLGEAARAQMREEFDLSELIRELAASESSDSVQIKVAGLSPFLVLASRGHIMLALRNAMLNAVEATQGCRERAPVVVNWGETDIDYWVVVLDRGVGLQPGLKRLFEISTTSKPDHIGMGLAIASQASISMGGRIVLSPREDGGTSFELRWPRILQ